MAFKQAHLAFKEVSLPSDDFYHHFYKKNFFHFLFSFLSLESFPQKRKFI